MPDRKHVGPPETRVCSAGEEGPTLNVVFTNSNRQILLIIPLNIKHMHIIISYELDVIRIFKICTMKNASVYSSVYVVPLPLPAG